MNSFLPFAFASRQLRRASWLCFALWTLAIATSALWSVQLLDSAMPDAATPQNPNPALVSSLIWRVAGVHASLWALGTLGIFLGARQMRRYLNQQLQAELEIRHQANFPRFNPNPVLELSAAGKINYSNDAAREMAHMLGQDKLEQILPPDSAAIIGECLTTGKPKLRVEIPIGSHVISWSFFPIKSDNTVHCYAGDITERKRGEEKLQETVGRLALATRVGGVGIWDYDVANNHLVWDDQMFRLYGIKREQFGNAYEAWQAGVHPEDRKRGDEEIQRALRDEKDFDTEFRVLWPDGSTHDICAIARVERDAHGKALRMIGTNWDITERKQMEQRLRQLSVAVEQSPASIIITNTAGNIEYVNPKFVEVTGYTPTEVLGKNPRVLKSGEKSPEDYRELWEAITTGKEWRGEFHNKKKSGERYWEFASISPIRDPAGRIAHFVAVKEDITARKKDEAERDKLIWDLQDALASVKALSGLLPICAACKKIRDDKGYWSQVESYIQKHSEATFTHGMCPDCAKKWYPGLVEDGLDTSPE